MRDEDFVAGLRLSENRYVTILALEQCGDSYSELYSRLNAKLA